MVLVVVSDGTSIHSGTVCAGPVAGTVLVGSNNFVTIGGKLIMVTDGTMEIPVHNNPPCIPPNLLSHSFSPSASQSYVTIVGTLMSLLGDAGAESTSIDGVGSNDFVTVS